MKSNSRDRLLISVAVIVAVVTLISPFLIFSLENSMTAALLSSCDGSSYSCWDKAKQEGKLSAWVFFSPLLIPILAIWSKWVWQIPYPAHLRLFDHGAYRIIEGLVLVFSVLISGNMLRIASTEKIESLGGAGLLNFLLLSVCLSGSILVVSWLLNRTPTSKMLYFAKISLILALATPFLYIGIALVREWGSSKGV